MSNNGGPAFPITEANGANSGDVGMSMRDYFATHANDLDLGVQAEIIRYRLINAGKSSVLPDNWRVQARYMHADAMLAERDTVR